MIKPESQLILDQIALILADFPDKLVVIAGYTDSAGAAEDNLLLSEARANSVRDYLTSKGTPPDTIRAYGYGERAPIADNETPEGRARNRRIEFNF